MSTHTCGYCDAYTNITPIAGTIIAKRPTMHATNYQVSIAAYCNNCKKISVANGISASPKVQIRNEGIMKTDSVIIETMRTLQQPQWEPKHLAEVDTRYLPEEIADAYQEAHNALTINAYRSVLILSRAIIEAAAKANNIEGKNLYTLIENLHKDGLIRSSLKEVAHAIRILGNDIAHGDLQAAPTREDAEDTLQLTRWVLDDIYVMDAKRADILNRRG